MFHHLEFGRMSPLTTSPLLIFTTSSCRLFRSLNCHSLAPTSSHLMRLSSANGAEVFADLLTLLLHVPVRTHTFKRWKWLEHIMSPESRNAMTGPLLKATSCSKKRRAKLCTVGWHSQSKRNAHSSHGRCSQHLQGEECKQRLFQL